MFTKFYSVFIATFIVMAACSAQATDLSLTKQALDENNSPILDLAPLGQVKYRIQVIDSQEGVTGTDILMTDNVPSLINIDSVETDFGTCDPIGQVVTCNLSGMADGATVTIFINGTLSGVAALGQEINNTAQVTATNEIQPSDNSDSIDFTVASETISDSDIESGGCSLHVDRPRLFLWNSLRNAMLHR